MTFLLKKNKTLFALVLFSQERYIFKTLSTKIQSCIYLVCYAMRFCARTEFAGNTVNVLTVYHMTESIM